MASKAPAGLPGVSVVICCHNSESRIAPTLAHLRAQETQGVSWEVVLVDNGSRDATARVARESWPEDAPAPLRIVAEPRLGLSYARHKGMSEARHEVISLIDDDNWVAPEWVQRVSEIFAAHPRVGACGGLSEAVCETEPPSWFPDHQFMYAVGAQGDEAGDVTATRGLLWGAGLNIRRAAWQELQRRGFRSVVPDRQGTSLSSGGDSEICLALRLAGWRLWYDPRLRLQHYLPSGRLHWEYLRRLYRGSAEATVGHDAYYFAFSAPGDGSTLKGRIRRTWQWQALLTLRQMGRRLGRALLALSVGREGDPDVLQVDVARARLAALFRSRKAYPMPTLGAGAPGWSGEAERGPA